MPHLEHLEHPHLEHPTVVGTEPYCYMILICIRISFVSSSISRFLFTPFAILFRIAAVSAVTFSIFLSILSAFLFFITAVSARRCFHTRLDAMVCGLTCCGGKSYIYIGLTCALSETATDETQLLCTKDYEHIRTIPGNPT
jgi:hypothetical protein